MEVLNLFHFLTLTMSVFFWTCVKFWTLLHVFPKTDTLIYKNVKAKWKIHGRAWWIYSLRFILWVEGVTTPPLCKVYVWRFQPREQWCQKMASQYLLCWGGMCRFGSSFRSQFLWLGVPYMWHLLKQDSVWYKFVSTGISDQTKLLEVIPIQ